MQTGVPICFTKGFVVSLLGILLIQIGLLQFLCLAFLCAFIILGLVAFLATHHLNYLLQWVFPEGWYNGNILQLKKQQQKNWSILKYRIPVKHVYMTLDVVKNHWKTFQGWGIPGDNIEWCLLPVCNQFIFYFDKWLLCNTRLNGLIITMDNVLLCGILPYICAINHITTNQLKYINASGWSNPFARLLIQPWPQQR